MEALQKTPYSEYLLDILLSGSMEERASVVAEYGKEVRKIEQRISEFTASHPAGRHAVSYTHLDVYKRQYIWLEEFITLD